MQIFPIFEEFRRLTADLDDTQFGKAVRYALGAYFGDEPGEESDILVKFVSKLLLDQASRYDEFREKQRGNATGNQGQPSAANVCQTQPMETDVYDVFPSPTPSPSPIPVLTQDNKADKPPAHRKFVPPTVQEVAGYCQEKGYAVDAERFVSYYEAIGWKVGRNPMKSWQAAVRTWASKEKPTVAPATPGNCSYVLATQEDPWDELMKNPEQRKAAGYSV